jgi:2,4-didehydro-3-deoxy-L-rhamnonate hydrolase
MKFGSVRGRACVVDGNRFVDLQDASDGELPADPMAYVISRWQSRARAFLERVPHTEYRQAGLGELGPPIPRPGKILAVALNYRRHAVEAGRDVPAEPAVFAKLTSSLSGPYDSIEVPDTCPMIDYEAEVVVVVGKTMRGVHADQAWDHIAGVTAGQDISDRWEQGRPPLSQFSLAKSYDTFSPIGPVMATLDEFANLDAITVIGRISGREVQRGDTGQLIYSIPELLAWTCRYVTLEPGDLVFTGTPDGVGSRRVPPVFLAEGMVLETEIPEVGTMRNDIRSVPAHPQRGPQPQLEVRP